MNGAVLLVGDDLPHLLALQDALEPLGLEIVMADSGDEALRLILQCDFAMVITDLKLPDMSGFEVCSLIRRRDRCRGIRVLITLDDADAMGLPDGRAGAFDVMSKPVQPELLRAKVVAARVAGIDAAP